MAVQVSYPGVYIEEFAPGAPIEGVGTSTAAFIGPAESGPIDIPTKVTSFARFTSIYGTQPMAGFYLWYAVKGFFENGGRVCYVVRASQADYATLIVNDGPGGTAAPVFTARAREPAPQSLDVEVSRNNRLAGDVYQPTATFVFAAADDRAVTINTGSAETDAARFRPTDVVDIGSPSGPVTVSRVIGDRIVFDRRLDLTPGTGNIRLADMTPDAKVVRIFSATDNRNGLLTTGAISPGSLLTVDQGGTTSTQYVDTVHVESRAVGAVFEYTYRVQLREPLGIAVDMTNPAAVNSEEFTIAVHGGSVTETYDFLAIDPGHPRYFADYVNDRDSRVVIEPSEPPSPLAPPGNIPNPVGPDPLTGGGASDDPATLGDSDYVQALDALRIRSTTSTL